MKSSGGLFDLPRLIRRVEELEAEMSQADFDWSKSAKVLQEKAEAEKVIEQMKDFSETLEMLRDEKDESEIDSFLTPMVASLTLLELQQRFTEPEDKLGAIVEINAGAGGVEAMDWCKILFRMYSRWADSHGFKVELLDSTHGEVAGFKSIAIEIVGANAFGLLKHVNGVHRLVRMSPFDAAGKRHTSFCSIAVTPDFPEEDDTVVIKHEDYQRDMFCAGGKGGQNVNKVASAVRLTHLKTGIVVKCQTERSQHENFRIAMQALKGKLFALQQAEKDANFKQKYENNKSDIAFGHQIRSYVMAPKQFVTDDRTDKQYYNVNAILDGDLDTLLQ